MNFDVFLSHSSHDKTIADAICARLEQSGTRCWMAPRDILPGDDWGDAISRSIDRCRIMVLVFSTSANQSKQVRREVERAIAAGHPIIPFRIDNTTPTEGMAYFLSTLHWLDALTPPIEQHIQRPSQTAQTFLADGISRGVNANFNQQFPATIRRSIRSRYLGLATIAAALLFLASWFGYSTIFQDRKDLVLHSTSTSSDPSSALRQDGPTKLTSPKQRPDAKNNSNVERNAQASAAPDTIRQSLSMKVTPNELGLGPFKLSASDEDGRAILDGYPNALKIGTIQSRLLASRDKSFSEAFSAVRLYATQFNLPNQHHWEGVYYFHSAPSSGEKIFFISRSLRFPSDQTNQASKRDTISGIIAKYGKPSISAICPATTKTTRVLAFLYKNGQLVATDCYPACNIDPLSRGIGVQN